MAPRTWRKLRRSIAALMPALALGCGGSVPPPLRIGTSPWPVYELLHLAQERGYLAEEGANVRFVELASLADVRRAFERGQLDGLVATPVEMVLLRAEQGRRPQVSYVLGWSQGADEIFVRGDLESVAALRGRRVAIESGSANLQFLAHALARFDIPLDAVHRIAVDPAHMPSALATGEVDAAVSYPPFSHAIRDAGGRAIFDSREIVRELLDLLVVDEDVLASRSDDVVALIRAYDRARQFALAHPQETDDILAPRGYFRRHGFSESLRNGIVLVSREQQPSFFGPDGSLAPTLRDVQKILLEAGEIHRAVDLDGAIAPEASDRAAHE